MLLSLSVNKDVLKVCCRVVFYYNLFYELFNWKSELWYCYDGDRGIFLLIFLLVVVIGLYM